MTARMPASMTQKEYDAIELDIVASLSELRIGDFDSVSNRLQGVLDLIDTLRAADRRAARSRERK